MIEPLLPDEAQEAVGQVFGRSQGVFDILLAEGFEPEHYIDIFDGGPILHARTSGIRSIARSRRVPVQLVEPPPVPPANRCLWLVSNDRLQDFRAGLLEQDWQPGRPLELSAAEAAALRIVEGQTVRLVAL